MMKRLIQKAKIKFFEPDEVSGSGVRLLDGPLQPDMSSWPITLNPTSTEQQRIQLLENQIQLLRADVARWQHSSQCFAYEMRDLLNEARP